MLMFIFIFIILLSSVNSIHDKCNDNIFILISNKTVLIYNFDAQNDTSPSIIYQTKSNITIENGLFYKRTNTIILLLKQFNDTYSIVSLNAHNNIYNSWKEKFNRLSYSSNIYLSLSQRYLYVLNSQTMLLQIFSLPLTSSPNKQRYLLNLPANQTISDYIVDEKSHFLWILYGDQLYTCQLKTFICYLYMNLFNLNKPIQVYINQKDQQFYLYSKDYIVKFEYDQQQTNYSFHSINSTQQNQNQFFTICEQTNHLDYISINYTRKRQVCYNELCQPLPLIFDDTSHIHTIRRLSTLSAILYCSKQRYISRIIILILILIDLAVIIGVIIWLGCKYIRPSTADKHEKRIGTIWTIEKDSVTHF